MLRTRVHPVAYEIDLLPGRRAQHSARVTFNAYKPLQRPPGSALNQHDPRTVWSTSSTVILSSPSATAAAAGVTVTPATSTKQLNSSFIHLSIFQFSSFYVQSNYSCRAKDYVLSAYQPYLRREGCASVRLFAWLPAGLSYKLQMKFYNFWER